MLAESLDEFRTFLDRTYVSYKLAGYRKESFAPKVPIEIDTAHYLVKTASSREELNSILRLRYEIFLVEGLNQKNSVRIDIDRYDSLCDHLIIIDKRTQQLVGTYRLISSTFSNDFYSANEFQLASFLALPGEKLELGRACIHKNYRNGIVIALLWRGVVNYLQATNSRYLFGCGTVKTEKLSEILSLYRYVRTQEYFTEDYGLVPTPAFRVPMIETALTAEHAYDATASELLPSLILSYIRAGAKICGEPALDRDFKCIDFMTILDATQLSKAFERKYRK